MKRMTRRRRTVLLATYLLAGSFILQLGPVCSLAATQGLTSFDVSLLLGEDESLFGLGIWYPCGEPNIRQYDQNGIPVGDVINAEDDLIVGCPITRITVTGGTGDG